MVKLVFLKQDLSNRTVRRCLNEKNYQYLQCRKKGLLNTEDMKSMLAFAKKVNGLLPKEFWQEVTDLQELLCEPWDSDVDGAIFDDIDKLVKSEIENGTNHVDKKN